MVCACVCVCVCVCSSSTDDRVWVCMGWSCPHCSASGPLCVAWLSSYFGRTDREQIRSRINNNDCRTFQPRRPLSTAYKTKEIVQLCM